MGITNHEKNLRFYKFVDPPPLISADARRKEAGTFRRPKPDAPAVESAEAAVGAADPADDAVALIAVAPGPAAAVDPAEAQADLRRYLEEVEVGELLELRHEDAWWTVELLAKEEMPARSADSARGARRMPHAQVKRARARTREKAIVVAGK